MTFSGKVGGNVPPLSGSKLVALALLGELAAGPQTHPLTAVPTLKTVQSVGSSGTGVLSATPSWRVERTLREHQKLAPRLSIVVMHNGSQGPAEGPVPKVAGRRGNVPKCGGTPNLDLLKVRQVWQASLVGRPGNTLSRTGGRAAGGMNPHLRGHAGATFRAALAVVLLHPDGWDFALQSSREVSIYV